MGGFFGAASTQDCVFDLFFGIDYHSHLGTFLHFSQKKEIYTYAFLIALIIALIFGFSLFTHSYLARLGRRLQRWKTLTLQLCRCPWAFFRRNICRHHLPIEKDYHIQRKNHNISIEEIFWVGVWNAGWFAYLYADFLCAWVFHLCVFVARMSKCALTGCLRLRPAWKT